MAVKNKTIKKPPTGYDRFIWDSWGKYFGATAEKAKKNKKGLETKDKS